MLQQLIDITPNEIFKRFNTDPPNSITPFHKTSYSKWDYSKKCFMFNQPTLRQFVKATQNGIMTLFENCINQQTDMLDSAKTHLYDHTVPYLLLCFLSYDAGELRPVLKHTIPPYFKNNDLFVYQVESFVILFLNHIHEGIIKNNGMYHNIFTTVTSFYLSIFDFVQKRDDIICSKLLKELNGHPSYYSKIQLRRLLIFTHLYPSIVSQGNKILQSLHPMIVMYQKLPSDTYLRPSTWKYLSTFLPKHLNPEGQRRLDYFKSLLYPPNSPLFEYNIPIGGGCGWSPSGIDICLVQLFTYLQPNWMELWSAMRWNCSVEMQKRLWWMINNEHEFTFNARDILMMLFAPE